MEEEKLLNVLHYYYETNTLKEVERTGWNYWNVSRDKRVESIPEHIYGTQQLAIAIFSEFNLDIDIYKVVTMLGLHETEEISIGDKTPFDGISDEKKLEMGKLAVSKTFSSLSKRDIFTKLIDEFNERKTPEAKFAYFCDKMECDLQAKKYSDDGRFSFEHVSKNIMEDERVKEIIKNGAKSVGEVFIDYDICRYAESNIFSDMIHFLRGYNAKQLEAENINKSKNDEA